MNPSEKAKELIDKFTEFNHEEFAQPHALIHVDEIIALLNGMNKPELFDKGGIGEFYTNVKQKLKKS